MGILDTIDSFKHRGNHTALIEDNRAITYLDLFVRVNALRSQLSLHYNSPRSILLQGDFSFTSIAYLLALLAENHVVSLSASPNSPSVEWCNQLGLGGVVNAFTGEVILKNQEQHSPLIHGLLVQREAGLLLLSSGTTGEPKWILHCLASLMYKYTYSKKSLVTLGFLLFDHIAGFDTLMYTLHAGGTLVLLENRMVGTVLETLQRHHVQVLPTTPSFLNLLLFEDHFSPNNLPFLSIITFGSERINDNTLVRLINRFGQRVRCEQKYGLTELGSLVLKSKPEDPRWVQFDNRFASWKIEDGLLHIKTDSTLLGYIYADREEAYSGWFNTGDLVEQEGEWLHILGRASDIINVGGQKVYPAEVESVLQNMENVVQVVAKAEPHPLMGHVVGVSVQITNDETEIDFRKRMRLYCKDKLASFKIPVSVSLQKEPLMTARFKIKRLS